MSPLSLSLTNELGMEAGVDRADVEFGLVVGWERAKMGKAGD